MFLSFTSVEHTDKNFQLGNDGTTLYVEIRKLSRNKDLC